MRTLIGLDIPVKGFVESGWEDMFFASMDVKEVAFQDVCHIISKLRNKLLETFYPMKIGTKRVSLEALRVSLYNQ